MYRIALCENDPDDSFRVESLLERFFREKERMYSFSRFASAEALLTDVRPHAYDIVLFDVEMDGMSGIEAAIQLRHMDRRVVIIFTTAHAGNVFSSFAAEPLNYLLKPLSPAAFCQAMKNALEKIDALARYSFTFSFNGTVYSVPVKEILYLESQQRLIYLHSVDQVYRFYGKLPDIRRDPVLADFITCHNSYYVNPEYIRKISSGSITLQSQEILPVSSSHTREVQSAYMDYVSNLI